MKTITTRTLVCTVVLMGSLLLPACSTLAVNPFKQQTDTETPATTNIRVETKPPEPKGQQEVGVNVGNNKQCTTFCALPMHKPPLN